MEGRRVNLGQLLGSQQLRNGKLKRIGYGMGARFWRVE